MKCTAVKSRPAIVVRPWAKYPVFAAAVATTVILAASMCPAGVRWAENGVLVSNHANNENAAAVVSDGAGGAIIAWDNRAAGSGQIFARRVRSDGSMAWGVVAVSTPGGIGLFPRIVSDGEGGAIIVWQYDSGGGSNEVLARRIKSDGSLPWGPVALGGPGVYNGDYPLVSDGEGGAIVAWQRDSGGGTYEVLARRIKSDGSLPWSAVNMVSSVGFVNYTSITTDCAGGAVVTWYQEPGGGLYEIRARRVMSNGSMPWGTVTVISDASNKKSPCITTDDAGGAHIAWAQEDGTGKADIYARRIQSNGSLPWSPVAVGSAAADEGNPEMCSDGAGGAIIAWLRVVSDWNLYARRIKSDGSLPWDPVALSPGAGLMDTNQRMTTDGEGGAIVAWQRESTVGPYIFDIYTSRITINGSLPWGCLAVSTDAHDDTGAALDSDGDGGAVIAWSRKDDAGKTDIYAQRAMETRLYPTWYLAEGTTDWGFSTHICVENPNSESITARVTYMTSEGEIAGPTFAMPPMSQATVNPAGQLGARDFSTRVECVEGKTIAVDRTMTWDSGAGEEGHSSVGVTGTATTWYLPEGSSDWGFECFLLVQNPNPQAANLTVTYMIQDEGPVDVVHTVPANGRATFPMVGDIGNKDASIEVSSDVPVIPERAMYRNGRREGHDSIGTTRPANDYYLAEGTSAWGFTTFVLVQNPNETPVDVTLTYMTKDGDKPQPSFTMQPGTRQTIKVNPVLPDTDFSTRVHGTLPIIAERAMYWGADTPSGEACHDSIGMASPHYSFYLPDGETTNGRETFTLVQNPNPSPVDVEISYLTPTGQNNVVFLDTIPANGRATYNMAARGIDGRAAIMVISKTPGEKIMVERAMYWNNRGAGTDTIGGYSD